MWYLSGPMSGIKDHNYPAFTASCILLRDLEWDIVSPQEEHPFIKDGDSTLEEWQERLRLDIKLILDCQGIILLQGWSKSRGAQLECYVALKLGMTIRLLEDRQIRDITSSVDVTMVVGDV